MTHFANPVLCVASVTTISSPVVYQLTDQMPILTLFQKMVYLQYLFTRLSQHQAPQILLNLKKLNRILKKAHRPFHQQPPLELQRHLMTHLESDGIHQAPACHRVQDHLWKIQVQIQITRLPQIKTNLQNPQVGNLGLLMH